jgi:geranylgeranyl diphosphate synthase type I
MNETLSQEEITKKLQQLLEEKGINALEMARKTVLEEKIESKEVREALEYFMNEYWYDLTRPALLSLVCEAVGGDPDKITPVAISMTLISGATDIHDDIVDQSKNKGSQPTVYGKFGKNIALLIGDALMFKGFTVLYEAVEKGIQAEKIAIISNIIKRTFFELGDAEALELQFRGRMDVTPEEYLHVVRKKAADVEACTLISAIVGNGSEEEVEALGEYGRILGMLYILRDDMIDMLDPEETVHRVKKEHLSLAILYALQNTKMASLIKSILKEPITKRDAEKLSTIVDEAGGFARIDDYMTELAEAAYAKVEKTKYNKKYLKLFIRGMLLPEWRSYLPLRTTPKIPDR